MYQRTWNKYLPAIRILIKRSATGEQKMDLSRMDFENGSRNRKLSCSFNIELERGRPMKMTQSVPAKSLIEVLLEDEVTKTLLRQYQYAFSLNSGFQLTIKNLTPPEVISTDTEGAITPTEEAPAEADIEEVTA